MLLPTRLCLECPLFGVRNCLRVCLMKHLRICTVSRNQALYKSSLLLLLLLLLSFNRDRTVSKISIFRSLLTVLNSGGRRGTSVKHSAHHYKHRQNSCYQQIIHHEERSRDLERSWSVTCHMPLSHRGFASSI